MVAMVDSRVKLKQEWWLTPVIMLGRLRQKDCHMFKASLSYIVLGQYRLQNKRPHIKTLKKKEKKKKIKFIEMSGWNALR